MLIASDTHSLLRLFHFTSLAILIMPITHLAFDLIFVPPHCLLYAGLIQRLDWLLGLTSTSSVCKCLRAHPMFLICVFHCDLSGKLDQVSNHQSVSVRSMTMRGDSDGLGSLPCVGRGVSSACTKNLNNAVLQPGSNDSILAPLSRSKATIALLLLATARCSGVRPWEPTASILAPFPKARRRLPHFFWPQLGVAASSHRHLLLLYWHRFPEAT